MWDGVGVVVDMVFNAMEGWHMTVAWALGLRAALQRQTGRSLSRWSRFNSGHWRTETKTDSWYLSAEERDVVKGITALRQFRHSF